MSGWNKAILLTAMLGLSACSNAIWDNTDGSSTGVGVGGSPLDPASPAYFQQEVGDRVLFAVDQSTLSPEATAVLRGQAAWLAANPEYTVRIEGHADEQGTREYNLGLGAKRANEARDFLIAQGIAGTRIQVVSFGKERPLEICSAESCYAKNRRAVTVLAGGLTG